MIWTTKDGLDIDIEDMSDSHLMNTILWMERNEERITGQHERKLLSLGEHALSCLQGEMALLEVEQELDNIMKDGVDLTDVPVYREMLRVGKARGLAVERCSMCHARHSGLVRNEAGWNSCPICGGI